jgi:hypothetical protein
LRLLLQDEEAWLKIEVINFDFRAARDFLHCCPQEQLSKLRSPGKLALNLSVHDWLSTQDQDWCAEIHKWSAYCATEMVNPWVIFTRAGFKKRRWELFLKHALRTTYKQHRDDSAIIQQFGMILEALLDICELNHYSRVGGMHARTYGRTAKELNSEEYYFKGIEYDNRVGPDPAAWQGFVEEQE